jgi:hypothetical protein
LSETTVGKGVAVGFDILGFSCFVEWSLLIIDDRDANNDNLGDSTVDE